MYRQKQIILDSDRSAEYGQVQVRTGARDRTHAGQVGCVSASGYVSLDKGKISELNFRPDQDQVRSVTGQNRITAGQGEVMSGSDQVSCRIGHVESNSVHRQEKS